jgi:hypothetical protein
MFSPHDPEFVMAELGDKFVMGVMSSTAGARNDLSELRSMKPLWVARMAERTLANFVHDRMWAYLVDAVGDAPAVFVRDEEPHRELTLGRYRVRCKRHDERNRIATYLTPEARAFWGEAQLQIPGLQEIKLAVGYRWLREERDIGTPLISYREGWDNLVWAVELGEAADNATPFTWTPITDPSLPQIDLYDASDDRWEEGQS